jgi:phosphoribosylglycinamide formyltransferase 1
VSTRIAVLASGGGSNLQALLDRFHDGGADADWWPRIVLVVSDRAGAGVLERAKRAGIEQRVVPAAGPGTESGSELLQVLDAAGVDIVVLAGYLKRVPAPVVARFRGCMVNVHPALLPAFGGKGMYGRRVHEAVLGAGCRVTGVTVHLVDEEYDRGPALAQWPVPVLPDDTADRLAHRVLRVEHRLLPLCVESLARRLAGAGGGAPPAADESIFDWSEAPAPPEAALLRALHDAGRLADD